MLRLAHVLMAAVIALFTASSWADEALPVPAGEVILEVTGAIERPNSDTGARFDRAMLEGLEQSSIRTTTPWTEGVQHFEGVLLEALLEAVGARGDVAVMTALNDYRVEVPLDEAVKWGAIIALKRNGEPMPVREKGPLWLIYPLDAAPEANTKENVERMIWQLRHIEIR